MDVPTILFAEARDGARLAYQDFGSGPPTVVAVPPMAQNVEMGWEDPYCRVMFDRFGSFSRWIQFDKRGTGCSDRRSHMPGIDERVDDLRAVMDAAGVQRAHLFGQSEGGPATILFAVTYPERVETITIFGSGARSTREYSPEELVEVKERYDWLSRVWGTPESPMLDAFAPSLADDGKYRAWYSKYERNSADGEALRQLLEINLDVDVGDVLGDVSVPTLVLHRTDDMIVPVELGRAAAAAIPGAKLVELEGADHFGHAGDIHAWIDEVERFVTGTVSERPAPAPRPGARIETLGRFAVVRGGEDVPVSDWGSRLARQLCKRLVAAGDRPVPREELIELLWPGEADSGRLGARLSVQLSGVRRVLGGGVIADRQTVALDLAEVATDLDDYGRIEDERAIVEAYGGEFLPEDRAEDWSAGPRDEARGRFIAAARRLA
ncbi:MAG: alpha/beta fold hydrolase, partial [Acidimicrobiales bacterium]